MNSEERRLLTEFLDQLKQVQGITKDAEAESLIRQAVSRQPDAHYLLVQKALLQEQALHSAKAQIGELQSRIEQLQPRSPDAPGSRFLSGDPWTARARPAPALSSSSPWPSAAAPPSGPGPLAGFLGTAAATAAGIAGGAFLFQGIESLLGHHGSGGSFFDTAGMQPERVENVTINEYYGTDDNQPDQEFLDADFDQPDEGFDAYDDEGDDTLSV